MCLCRCEGIEVCETYECVFFRGRVCLSSVCMKGVSEGVLCVCKKCVKICLVCV